METNYTTCCKSQDKLILIIKETQFITLINTRRRNLLAITVYIIQQGRYEQIGAKC